MKVEAVVGGKCVYARSCVRVCGSNKKCVCVCVCVCLCGESGGGRFDFLSQCRCRREGDSGVCGCVCGPRTVRMVWTMFVRKRSVFETDCVCVCVCVCVCLGGQVSAQRWVEIVMGRGDRG